MDLAPKWPVRLTHGREEQIALEEFGYRRHFLARRALTRRRCDEARALRLHRVRQFRWRGVVCASGRASPKRAVMSKLDALLAANDGYAAAREGRGDPRPKLGLAVVTCMDARLDVAAALGLDADDAHVIRNAGGRVTDDVLRSLALSSHALGVDTVVVMQHTKCRLAAATNEELRRLTGADFSFLPIDDHLAALRADVELLATLPYLTPVTAIAGMLYDLDTGAIDDLVRWERPS